MGISQFSKTTWARSIATVRGDFYTGRISLGMSGKTPYNGRKVGRWGFLFGPENLKFFNSGIFESNKF